MIHIAGLAAGSPVQQRLVPSVGPQFGSEERGGYPGAPPSCADLLPERPDMPLMRLREYRGTMRATLGTGPRIPVLPNWVSGEAPEITPDRA